MERDSIFTGIVVNENSYTQLLVNLLDRHEGFRIAVLSKLFSARVANELSDYQIDTQQTLKDGSVAHGKPDILIRTEAVCAIVEVKTELGCLLTGHQKWSADRDETTRGYAEYLKRQNASDRYFVFLIPKGWKYETEHRDYIERYGLQDGVRFKIVTWEEIFCTIDESMETDPFINEFKSLLSKRFQPLKFTDSEVNLLQQPEVLSTVSKLSKLVSLVFQKAESAEYTVKWERAYQDGSYGFYFKNGTKDLLYFGWWVSFSQKSLHPLCFGIEDKWGDDLKRRFLNTNPYETITIKDKTRWTMSWVPDILLSDDDAASKIWECIEPIVQGLYDS
jgi:hypothetical protein